MENSPDSKLSIFSSTCFIIVPRKILLETGLPTETLGKIWGLSDRDKDGQLNQEEFVIATWLADQALAGKTVPDVLPPELTAVKRLPQKADKTVSSQQIYPTVSL